MKANIRQWADSIGRGGLLLGLCCWVAFISFTSWAPASWWLEVQRIHIPTAQAGEPVEMQVSRTIKRDFVATWTVSIRTADLDSELICVGSGKSNYREGANLPKSLTLAWWTGGACHTLPAGQYWLATDWDIQPNGIWPGKRVSMDSNRFTVAK